MDKKVPAKTNVGAAGPRERSAFEQTLVPDRAPAAPAERAPAERPPDRPSQPDRPQKSRPISHASERSRIPMGPPSGDSLSLSGSDRPRSDALETRLEERRKVEEAILRRPESLDKLIQKLPGGTPARQLLEAFADSFLFQLVGALTATVTLVVFFHLIDPTARFAASLLYVYFLALALFFARFRPHLAVFATGSLIAVAILLFAIPAGTVPLLAFRPTLLFWVSVGVINGIATSLFNRHVEALVDSRVSMLALQHQLRNRDESSGRAMGIDKTEEHFNIARQAEAGRRDVLRHYSSLFLYMHKLSQNLDPEQLVGAIWGILKHGIQATACEIYTLKGNELELNHAFRQPANVDPEETAGGAFEDKFSQEQEHVPLSENPHRIVPVGPDAENLLAYVVQERKSVFFEEVARDPRLQGLAGKCPVPVAYAYPLIDVRNGVVKGLINVSQCRKTKLSDEDRQIVRTTADLSAMAISHWEVLEKEKGRARELKKHFETLVSPRIVEELTKNPELADPRRQKVTVMFVDLRGFTNISEANPPQVVVALLADFFGKLTPFIVDYDGTLDKYIGDEIMALWGAPNPSPTAARKAVLAAWRMREAFGEVRDKWAPRLGRPVEIGIAINTGEAMVGFIGATGGQKGYTAIGDAVNTAARLEGETPANRIHLTRATYEEVKDMVEGEWQPPVRVQGKAEPLERFLVTSIKSDLVDASPTRDEKSLDSSFIMSSRDLARQVRSGAPGDRSGRTARGDVPPGLTNSLPHATRKPAASPAESKLQETVVPASRPGPAADPARPAPARPLDQTSPGRVVDPAAKKPAPPPAQGASHLPFPELMNAQPHAPRTLVTRPRQQDPAAAKAEPPKPDAETRPDPARLDPVPVRPDPTARSDHGARQERAVRPEQGVKSEPAPRPEQSLKPTARPGGGRSAFAGLPGGERQALTPGREQTPPSPGSKKERGPGNEA